MNDYTSNPNPSGTAYSTWGVGFITENASRFGSASNSAGGIGASNDTKIFGTSVTENRASYGATSDFTSNSVGFTNQSRNGFTNLLTESATIQNGTDNVVGITVKTSGDTQFVQRISFISDVTAGTDITNTTEITGTTVTDTSNGAAVTGSSSAGDLGYPTSTVNSSSAEGFGALTYVTKTISITTASNPTQTATSTSSWDLVQSVTTVASSQKTDAITTGSITYASDFTTRKTYNPGGGPVPVTTDIVTGFYYDQLRDTVVLQRAGRDYSDYTLGNMLWKFSAAGFATSESTTGRFSDLYSSAAGETLTISDYGKYTTATGEVSNITFSRDTTATVTIIGPTSATSLVSVTVFFTSKNGTLWSSSNTSNTATVTHTAGIGDVGTSLSTHTLGTDTLSETILTHTVQITGYDTNQSWTASTTTGQFPGTNSQTETVSALYSSVSTTLGITSRVTTTDDVLFSSVRSYAVGGETSFSFFGMVRTTTTAVLSVSTTHTFSKYPASLHNTVEKYQTSSGFTTGDDAAGATYTINQDFNITYHTEARVEPCIYTSPIGQDFPIMHSNEIWFRGPAYGYAGFCGTFNRSSLDVHSTITSGLVSGGSFPDCSIGTEHLPTVLLYPGVTGFPVESKIPLTIEHAQRAHYLANTASGIGDASVAVTWTSTAATTGEVTTTTTSTSAVYSFSAQSPITGEYWRSEEIQVNTTGRYYLVGGYAGGINALGNSYEVRCASGVALWTEYSAGESSGGETNSTVGTNGFVNFTVAGDRAIVLSIEPLFTANWTGEFREPFYFSSTPHVPWG